MLKTSYDLPAPLLAKNSSSSSWILAWHVPIYIQANNSISMARPRLPRLYAADSRFIYMPNVGLRVLDAT